MPDVTSPFAFPYPEDTDLVRDGAQDIENLATGVNDYLAGGFLYAGTRYYTSSGSFAKADPLGTGALPLRAIRIRLVGAGGGGGGAGNNGDAGGGGGAGGYAERFFTDIASLDASVTVTRGSGGAGAAAGNNAGTAGGESSFGGVGDAWRTRATGGAGGLEGTEPRGGIAGDGENGDLLIGGQDGMAGSTGSTAAGSGGGGTSMFGGGAIGRAGNANSPGFPSKNFGGGGGGGVRASLTNAAGGAGANGIVIVDVFV